MERVEETEINEVRMSERKEGEREREMMNGRHVLQVECYSSSCRLEAMAYCLRESIFTSLFYAMLDLRSSRQ
jgi:hypothetical protein